MCTVAQMHDVLQRLQFLESRVEWLSSIAANSGSEQVHLVKMHKCLGGGGQECSKDSCETSAPPTNRNQLQEVLTMPQKQKQTGEDAAIEHNSNYILTVRGPPTLQDDSSGTFHFQENLDVQSLIGIWLPVEGQFFVIREVDGGLRFELGVRSGFLEPEGYWYQSVLLLDNGHPTGSVRIEAGSESGKLLISMQRLGAHVWEQPRIATIQESHVRRVVAPTLYHNVLKWSCLNAPIIAEKMHGTVLLGCQVGNWFVLADQPGVCLIDSDDGVCLEAEVVVESADHHATSTAPSTGAAQWLDSGS